MDFGSMEEFYNQALIQEVTRILNDISVEIQQFLSVKILEDIYNSYLTACEGSSLIISRPLTMTGTFCVAEYVGVKWLPVILGPTMPTSEFPIWPLKSLIFSSCMNKWSYNVVFKMLWKSEAKFINPWRQNKLGKSLGNLH